MVGGNSGEMLWPLLGPVSESHPETPSMETSGQGYSSYGLLLPEDRIDYLGESELSHWRLYHQGLVCIIQMNSKHQKLHFIYYK